MTGIVTKIQKKTSRPKKSYGIITSLGDDYWFSLMGIKDINVGDLVDFTGGENEKGFVASNVRLVHA